jgi:site-specific DNA recombinase
MFFQCVGLYRNLKKRKLKSEHDGADTRKAKKGLVVKNNHIYGYSYDKEKNTYRLTKKKQKLFV